MSPRDRTFVCTAFARESLPPLFACHLGERIGEHFRVDAAFALCPLAEGVKRALGSLEVAVAALGFWLLIASAGHELLDFDRNNGTMSGALALSLLVVSAAAAVWSVARRGAWALAAPGPLALLVAFSSSHAKVAALFAFLAVVVVLALECAHPIRSVRQTRTRSV